MQRTRLERDSIGEMRIPVDADYGIHTARAAENFPITGILLRHFPEFVQSLAMTKKAAAMANRELGKLKPDTPIATSVHSSQVVDDRRLVMMGHDSALDYIATEQELIVTDTPYTQPSGVAWDHVQADQYANIPFLTELRKRLEH